MLLKLWLLFLSWLLCTVTVPARGDVPGFRYDGAVLAGVSYPQCVSSTAQEFYNDVLPWQAAGALNTVGSRGLVFGVKEGADVGHYFNFVNTKAGPVFLEFQKGAAISPGNFSGFRLLQTH